ncbi:MAG: site-specific integrase [Planctomycetales bacterium]|nr:site-specific integrase [Planctomycetales bacterium]
MRGHIHKRVRTNAAGTETVRWYVVVDVGIGTDGRRKQKWHGGFDTRREAEVERAKIVNSLHSGSYTAPNRLTFGQWAVESWLPMIRTRIKPSTYDSYRSNMEIHVLPAIGHRGLQQLTALMLNTLYAELLRKGGERGPLAPKTVRYIHTTIHKVLADAVDAGVVGSNVAERAKPPRPGRVRATRIECWEPEELAAFLTAVRGDRLEAAWRTAAMTGMRRGEVLGLRWGDVDLDDARISIRNAIVSVAYEVLESSPKSHQARVVDLDPLTVEMLRAHHSRCWKELSQEPGERQLVFSAEDGSPIHPQSFSQAFGRIIERANLRKIRLHDLRHTHATIAVKAGVPVKVISERLGHESPAFTLKQYAHVMPGMQAEAAEQIAALVVCPKAAPKPRP